MEKFYNAFPALQHRNYQLWFAGQLISLIGTWVQIIALGWMVLQMTNSALWVGIISSLSSIPVLIFSLFGGVIVDRFSKKRVLFAAEFFAMVLAFILGILTLLNVISLNWIVVITFLFGIAHAIDTPARQALVVDLVGKESLASAIALNSGIFNTARIIGPGIAGALIAFFGLGGAFIINGLSFLAVLIALFFIKVKKTALGEHPHPVEAIKEGLAYAFSNGMIKNLLFYVSVVSIFGWSYAIILPVIVKNIYNLGAAELGYFNAVAGLGALLGTLILSGYSKKVNPILFIFGGNLLFAFSLILFSFVSNIILASVFLFTIGLGLIMQFSTINSTIQHEIKDSFRGRIMSIYALMFMGVMPLGSLQAGFIAEHWGAQAPLRIGAIIIMIFGIYLYLNHKKYFQNHSIPSNIH